MVLPGVRDEIAADPTDRGDDVLCVGRPRVAGEPVAVLEIIRG
jgi:hypothetical protein